MDDARKYQIEAMDSIRAEFLKGNRKVLLWLATGAGKTFIFCRMIKEAVNRGFPAIVVVRGRKLVDQASQRLLREKVMHGTLMANHWNYRPTMPVQVCSIDTLISRKMKPKAKLIVIDEAHLAVSKGYKEFLSQYDDVFVVAVTATPWVGGGLRHLADAIVHPISMNGLIEMGFLVPFKPYAPAEPDLTDVAISSSTKDYVTDQLADAMLAGQLTGKIVDHYRKLSFGLPTICFAVNINHSKILVDKFNEAGIRAEHCDADSTDAEREQTIRRLESGETKVICNVGIFCTGVDIPCVRTIIMARPTRSRNLFVQQAGRGTRPFHEKSFCLLLDHAGNINRHGLPTDETDVDLDGREKRAAAERESKTCKVCFAVFRGKNCPECGTEPPPMPPKEIEESDDELVEVDEIRVALIALIKEADHKGRRRAWAYHEFIRRYPFEQVKGYLPKWFVELQQNPFAKSPFRSL